MSSHVTRRTILQSIGSAVLIVACQAGKDSATDTDTGPTGTGSDEIDPKAWASGGTAAISDSASYPDPFATAAATECALLVATTEGPCTTTATLERTDVSEDWDGLPVRLVLKVVDAECVPISGVEVKIWHTNYEGSYSGQTPNNNMCLEKQSYASLDFFRGAQTTDSSGVVSFDTCFPGWYSGRAVHIHIQVSGTIVTQIFFPEEITSGVFSNHTVYKSFGQPDTTFLNDGIMAGIPASSRARHTVDVAQMTDGVMLASKVITVR